MFHASLRLHAFDLRLLIRTIVVALWLSYLLDSHPLKGCFPIHVARVWPGHALHGHESSPLVHDLFLGQHIWRGCEKRSLVTLASNTGSARCNDTYVGHRCRLWGDKLAHICYTCCSAKFNALPLLFECLGWVYCILEIGELPSLLLLALNLLVLITFWAWFCYGLCIQGPLDMQVALWGHKVLLSAIIWPHSVNFTPTVLIYTRLNLFIDLERVQFIYIYTGEGSIKNLLLFWFHRISDWALLLLRILICFHSINFVLLFCLFWVVFLHQFIPEKRCLALLRSQSIVSLSERLKHDHIGILWILRFHRCFWWPLFLQWTFAAIVFKIFIISLQWRLAGAQTVLVLSLHRLSLDYVA